MVPVLTAKLAGKNVSKKLIDSYATQLAEMIEDEQGIESIVDSNLFGIIIAQKEADRVRTETATSTRKEAADAAAGKKPDEQGDQKPELPADAPDYVKALMAKIEGMETTIAGFKSAEQAKTIQERFLAHEDVKKVPQGAAKRYVPKTEEDFDAALTELKTDFAPLMEQSSGAPSFGAGSGLDHPATGKPTGGGSGTKEASKEALDAAANSLAIKI